MVCIEFIFFNATFQTNFFIIKLNLVSSYFQRNKELFKDLKVESIWLFWTADRCLWLIICNQQLKRARCEKDDVQRIACDVVMAVIVCSKIFWVKIVFFSIIQKKYSFWLPVIVLSTGPTWIECSIKEQIDRLTIQYTWRCWLLYSIRYTLHYFFRDLCCISWWVWTPKNW
jgi:hypothetical protein